MISDGVGCLSHGVGFIYNRAGLGLGRIHWLLIADFRGPAEYK